MTEPEAHPATAIWSSAGRQLLVLAGLTGFAISQPLLSVLGDAPTELAYYGVEGSELAVLACVVAFVPPLVLFGATRLAAAAGGQLHRWLHLSIVAGLAGLFAIQVAKSAGIDRGVALAAIAALTGVGFAVLYIRLPPVATWASYTAVLPLLAVGSFLLVSPASALLSSADAPERTGDGDAPSVLLIVLDELPTRSLLDPDDQIDATRFPNLAAFAEDATWYRHNTTLATHTEAAVPSMLTGKRPRADQATWANHPDNLFTLLAPTHELEVLEQATQLCPYDVCVPTGGTDDGATDGDEAAEAVTIAGPGFGDLLGVVKDLWFERVSLGEEEPAGFDDFIEQVGPADGAEATIGPAVTVPQPRPDGDPSGALSSARADALIQSFDPAKGSALYYVHLMLPHQPFHRYPDGTEYEVLDPKSARLPLEDAKRQFSWSPWASAVSEQQHLLQAQYADRVVGQLLDGVRASGLYDDSLVIVTADHGVSFEAKTAGRFVQPSNVDAIGYTPLLIKAPGQADGAVDDSNMTIVDLLPTIADELDVSIPWSVDGAPAGSPAIAERGGAKEIYDMIALGGLQVRGIIEYEDDETFSGLAERFIGPLPDPADPLSALHARLGIEDLIGARLEDLVDGDGGSVGIDGLDQARWPGDGPTMGLITGVVDDAPDGARLLLAVDGVVVGGSALSTDSDGVDGHVLVLIPQGALGADNDIRAALVDDEGRVVELEVREL